MWPQLEPAHPQPELRHDGGQAPEADSAPGLDTQERGRGRHWGAHLPSRTDGSSQGTWSIGNIWMSEWKEGKRETKVISIKLMFRVTLRPPWSFPLPATSGACTSCTGAGSRQTPSRPCRCRIRGNTRRETNTKGITVLWIWVLRAGPPGSRKNVAVVLVIRIDLGKHSHSIKSKKYALNPIRLMTSSCFVVIFFLLRVNERTYFWSKCVEIKTASLRGDKFLLIRHHRPKIFFYVLHF